jgi:hypothetical protein
MESVRGSKKGKKGKRRQKFFFVLFALFAFFVSLRSFLKPRRRRIRKGSIFASAHIV